MVVRFAPTVHGAGGDHGFVAVLAKTAREKGECAFIAEGRKRWPAVDVLDAGTLVQLAIQKTTRGSVLHAFAEEGIATRGIGAALGRLLHVPVASIPADRVQAPVDWLGRFFGADAPASSARWCELLGWTAAGGHRGRAPSRPRVATRLAQLPSVDDARRMKSATFACSALKDASFA